MASSLAITDQYFFSSVPLDLYNLPSQEVAYSLVTLCLSFRPGFNYNSNYMLDAGNWFTGLGLLVVLVAAWFGYCWACAIRLSSCSRNVSLGVALHLPSAKDYLITLLGFKWFGF